MTALLITGLILGGPLPLVGADDSAAPADPAPADPVPSGAPLVELIDAAVQRLQTADPVAATKWLTGAAITDPVRVEQVLETVSTDAETAGVPGDYMTALFTDQINATEAIQYSRFAAWKLDPTTAPDTAPELEASRALIDGLNGRMVALIATDWPVLGAPDCPILLDAARNAVIQARQLDPLLRQALESATRSYCLT